MRELKFRVWSEEDKEYRTDLNVFRLHDGKIICTSPAYSLEGDRFDVEQYTGLKDKNGKEIYYGDVIRFDNVDAEAEVSDPATVVYENGAFLLKCSDEKLYTFEHGTPVVLGFIKPELFEVIGNIHENPELLGEEE